MVLLSFQFAAAQKSASLKDGEKIFIQFKPYSLELTDEGAASMRKLIDSIKMIRGIKRPSLYLRTFGFAAELKKDSFICAKRLHILNIKLYNSCLGRIKDVYSINNFEYNDDAYGRYSEEEYTSLLRRYCGVFVEIR